MNGKRRWPVAFLTLAALFASAALLPGKGKPPAPETPPPGTIYFSQQIAYPIRYTLGMNTDGSGKDFALPPVDPIDDEDVVTVSAPSRQLYDGRRIWLVHVNLARYYPGDNELFAVRPTADGTDFEWIQITDVNPAWTVDFQGAQWSNDGQDTFISFVGHDHRSETGEAPRCLNRLNVSGAMLATAFEFPDVWTPLTGDDVETVVCEDYPNSFLNSYHDWSPDGNRVLYLIGLDLHVYDTTTNTDTLISSSSGSGKWSPDGSRIAYSGSVTIRNTAKHGIVTADSDGSNKSLILEDKGHVSYTSPRWAPNGTHLAIEVWETVIVNGHTDTHFHIGRIKADGSGLTILTDDLDPSADKRLLGWR